MEAAAPLTEGLMLLAETDFWTALFANLPATLFALASLVGVVLTHFKVKEVKAEVVEVKYNVVTIEKATNSMQDALVKATGDAAFLEGKAAERKNPEINL